MELGFGIESPDSVFGEVLRRQSLRKTPSHKMYAIIQHRAEPSAPHNSSKPTFEDPFWLPGRPLITEIGLHHGRSTTYGNPIEPAEGITEYRCFTPKRGVASAFSIAADSNLTGRNSLRYLRRVHDSILDDFARCQMRMMVRTWAVKIRISELVFCTSPDLGDNAWAVIVQSDLNGGNEQEILVYRGGRTDLMMAVNNSVHFRGLDKRLRPCGSGWSPVLGGTLSFDLFKEPEGIDAAIPHLSCGNTSNRDGQPFWHSVTVRELPQSSCRTGSGISDYLPHLTPRRPVQFEPMPQPAPQPTAQLAGAV